MYHDDDTSKARIRRRQKGKVQRIIKVSGTQSERCALCWDKITESPLLRGIPCSRWREITHTRMQTHSHTHAHTYAHACAHTHIVISFPTLLLVFPRHLPRCSFVGSIWICVRYITVAIIWCVHRMGSLLMHVCMPACVCVCVWVCVNGGRKRWFVVSVSCQWQDDGTTLLSEKEGRNPPIPRVSPDTKLNSLRFTPVTAWEYSESLTAAAYLWNNLFVNLVLIIQWMSTSEVSNSYVINCMLCSQELFKPTRLCFNFWRSHPGIGYVICLQFWIWFKGVKNHLISLNTSIMELIRVATSSHIVYCKIGVKYGGLWDSLINNLDTLRKVKYIALIV